VLALLAALALRLGWVRTAAACAASLAPTLAANILRAASLFILEVGQLGALPAASHEWVGLAAFLVAAVALLAVIQALVPSEELSR